MSSPLDRPYFRKNTKDCAQQSYVIIERRNGDTKISRRVVGGKVEVLARVTRTNRKAKVPTWSDTNGVIGDEATLRAAKKLDHDLGASDDVEYRQTRSWVSERTGKRMATWQAYFPDRDSRARWLHKHKRWDKDAGYKEPAPGDFRNSTPQEFE